MRFICINDCDNSEVKAYKSDKTFSYEKGKVYEYRYNQYYEKNSISLVIKGNEYIYRGSVDNDFINKNFLLEIDAIDIIEEINELFENILS